MTNFDLVLRGGAAILPGRGRAACDIAICDGRIAAIVASGEQLGYGNLRARPHCFFRVPSMSTCISAMARTLRSRACHSMPIAKRQRRQRRRNLFHSLSDGD